MARPDPRREINPTELRRAAAAPGALELITYDPSQPPPEPPPARLFEGLAEPREAPYAAVGSDPTGVANVWRALANL